MDTEQSIRSYLYKSARNLALNQIKHQKIKDKYDSEWMEQKENPVIEFRDEYREEHIRNAIAQAIEELPERSRMTYKLHRYDGLTYKEIAEVMDVSVKTVESQMTRALKETINKVRGRPSVNLPPVTETDQNQLREILRRERRVELAFEGLRLWDLKRWGIAEEVLTRKFFGMKLTDDPENYNLKIPSKLKMGRLTNLSMLYWRYICFQAFFVQFLLERAVSMPF